MTLVRATKALILLASSVVALSFTPSPAHAASYLWDIVIWLLVTAYRNHINRDLQMLRIPIPLVKNGWGLGHFASYFCKGVQFGVGSTLWFFLVGASFELVEQALSMFHVGRFVDSSLVDDPIINTAGYVTGALLAALMGWAPGLTIGIQAHSYVFFILTLSMIIRAEIVLGGRAAL